jgi:cold shock CspA family protein
MHRAPRQPTNVELLQKMAQGVIKAYDPATGEGVIVRDTDRSEYILAPDALVGSVFRMLRQGQRVVFDLDAMGQATRLRLGSEVDMGSPNVAPPPPRP